MRYIVHALYKIVGYSLNIKVSVSNNNYNYNYFKIDEDVAFTVCRFPCIKSASDLCHTRFMISGNGSTVQIW